MEKRVAIVGGGISGLLACKYTVEKGFQPVIFEAGSTIGGVWAKTMESTKLQTPRYAFQFSDLPWPSTVRDLYPTQSQVMEYIESYARHFNLLPYIRFECEVVGMDFVGVSEEEMELWDLWGGNCRPLNSTGKWLLNVKDKKRCSQEEYEFEFVILCIGRYSGLPNIPEFPPGRDPQTFNGKVLHSMDYSAMDNANAKEMIKGKRIAVVGAQKSALDIAAECAKINGVDCPCTMIQRTFNWAVPSRSSNLDSLFFSRFSELMVHKPNETFLQGFLATLLSPMRWAVSKLVESYLRCQLPLDKYKMVPKHSFMEQFSSCKVPMLPDSFFGMVEEGSIILKKSQNLSFCSEGLIIDEEIEPLGTDLVILATGFKTDEKLKNMFSSLTFQQYCLNGPSSTQVALYKHIIHPRIPQLAVIGYSESPSNLRQIEIQCRWLSRFLCGSIELYGIREMEKTIVQWENCTKSVAGKYPWRYCCIANPIWYNDEMCRDMGCEPRWKKGFFAEWFEPYGPLDYVELAKTQ